MIGQQVVVKIVAALLHEEHLPALSQGTARSDHAGHHLQLPAQPGCGNVAPALTPLMALLTTDSVEMAR
jgi:hypothetical protein